MGCGSGSTGNELDTVSYRQYTGVDISDVAIDKATVRTAASGRAHKNRYVQADMATYVPTHDHEVILFRDSIYYLPHRKIKAVLDRYSRHLTPTGVLIVRMYDRGKYTQIVAIIERHFQIVEKYSASTGVLVLVLRPRQSPGSPTSAAPWAPR
jgi:trans-aconitate methyltransferase